MKNDTNKSVINTIQGTLHRKSYQYDRSGALLPVLELRTVVGEKLYGTKCKVPISFFDRTDLVLAPGDQLIVSYDNDRVVTNIKILIKFTPHGEELFPHVCPLCGNTLYTHNYIYGDLSPGNVCHYNGCYMRTYESITTFRNRVGIQFDRYISVRIIQNLIAKGMITTPDTLMDISINHIVDLDNVVYTNDDILHLLDVLRSHRGVSFDHFLTLIFGYDIPGINLDDLVLFAKYIVSPTNTNTRSQVSDFILKICNSSIGDIDVILSKMDLSEYDKNKILSIFKILRGYFDIHISSIGKLAVWYITNPVHV